MPNENGGVRVRVWGDLACFTRPEMKVERVSYDVMTPSAARGILEAVLWKPQIRWIVQSIEVLRPIQWTSVRRNEVAGKVSASKAKTAMRRGTGRLGMYVDEGKTRQQRAAMLLKNVEYVIHARFELTVKAGSGDTPGKYLEMARRRIEKGQCFHRPYLGCREFAADFGPPTDDDNPIDESLDLGWMLHDLDYSSRSPTPRFFRARLIRGRLDVPPPDSPEVRG